MSTENFRPETDETLDIAPSDAGSTTADGFTEYCGVWKVRCNGPRCDGTLVTQDERERCGCDP